MDSNLLSHLMTPLRVITAMGLLVFVGSFLMTLYILYIARFTGKIVPGWASTVLPLYFIDGIQRLALG